MGLDPDWDGTLAPEDEARLSGFDMNWDAGLPGDTYALPGEAPLTLSRPREWTASYVDGKITSSHLRSFDAPVPVRAAPLIVLACDPG
jgi:polyphosphate kinase